MSNTEENTNTTNNGFVAKSREYLNIVRENPKILGFVAVAGVVAIGCVLGYKYGLPSKVNLKRFIPAKFVSK